MLGKIFAMNKTYRCPLSIKYEDILQVYKKRTNNGSGKKWAKDWKRLFTQKQIQMASRYSNTVTMSETQIKVAINSFF